MQFNSVLRDAWYYKAMAYAKIKNKDKMIESLKKSIELDPHDKIYAKENKSFKEYWNDPDFIELVK